MTYKKFLFSIVLIAQITYAKTDEMEMLYLQNGCNGCHGMYGEGMADAPRLQGIREEVLLKRLQNLQQGKTRSAFGSVMISFAKALDENQTKKMAHYLSRLKTTQSEERYEIPYSSAGDGGS
jgi:cytochrome c553